MYIWKFEICGSDKLYQGNSKGITSELVSF